MCVHIFSPGRELHIDYASESITLVDGGRDDLLDLLLTNHSEEPADRFHLVYPQAVPFEATCSESNFGSQGFFDLTGTWLDPDSPYNDFYETEDVETHREIAGDDGTGVKLTVSMINPYDITQQEPYVGYVHGGWELTRFDPSGAATPLTEREWEWLTRFASLALPIVEAVRDPANRPRIRVYVDIRVDTPQHVRREEELSD